MFVNATALKEHFGTETLLEALQKREVRSQMSNCALFRNGKHVDIFWSNDFQLYRMEFDSNGRLYRKPVTEEYLNELAITTLSFRTITGLVPPTEFDMDFDKLADEASAELRDEEGVEVKSKTSVIISSIIVVTAVALGLCAKKSIVKPTPEPKPRKR